MYKIIVYKRFLKSFSLGLPREVFQILYEITFLVCNLFCTYLQDKKIESKKGEGLLEIYL